MNREEETTVADSIVRRRLRLAAASLVLAIGTAGHAQETGRAYFATNCASGCHLVPPVLSVPHTAGIANLNLTSSSSGNWIASELAFKSRLSTVSGSAPQMATLASEASTTNRDNVLTYLRAVRDGVRTLDTAPVFATTAVSRSSTGSSFQVSIRNYRGETMGYSLTVAGSEFSLLSAGSPVASLTGSCAAAASPGTPTTCVVNGSIRFTPSAVGSTPRTSNSNLTVSSTWTSSDPQAPATADNAFAIAANVVDAFTTAPAAGSNVAFVTTSTVPTDTRPINLTDNVGDELRACLVSGDAPFDGLTSYSLGSSSGTVSGACVIFAAAAGVSPVAPRTPLPINVTFAPGAVTTPLNARLQIQRYVASAPTGELSTLQLSGNAGPAVAVDQARLFTSDAIEVDGSPASVDRSFTVLSLGSSAVSFAASPPPFRLSAGTSSGGICQPVAAAPAAPAPDYSVVAGGCAALSGLSARAGTPNQCTLTLRFDATAIGPRCALLTVNTNTSTQTVVLEGTGFLGPRPVVLDGVAAFASGALLDFTTQRTTGATYPPRTLTLRNGATLGNLEVVLPAAGAVTGFTIARSGACSSIAPFDPSAPGPQCQLAVSFLPSELRSYTGSFDILTRPAGSSGAYSAFRVNLAGVGSDAAPALRWENGSGTEIASLSFAKQADIACTTDCVKTVVLRNLGPGSARVDLVNAIGTEGASWSARLDGCTAGQFIAATTGSCNVVVTFAPSTAGTKSATLQAVTNGNGPPTLALTGTSSAGSLAPQLAVSQAGSFAITRVGSRSAPIDVALTNGGTFALQVLDYKLTGPFSVQSTSCPGLPFSLAAGGGCIVKVTFDANAAGDSSGTLEVRTDASPATVTYKLTGTGEAAADVSSGGCSIASGRSLRDPTLWVLVALALVALVLRRRRDSMPPRARRRIAPWR